MLTKEEFHALWRIAFGVGYDLKDVSSADLALMNHLEVLGLLKIEYRKGVLYGLIETVRGHDEYAAWHDECCGEN
ncbi:MAG: hypothetical protein Q7R96_05300 [Nanoarchaeota archaeon]|nr:hypothetical protein [Nanoarchaeota archaeon]